MDDVKDVVETAEKIIKVAPKVYDDGLKPAVSESGKTLALIPKAINAALVPLRIWIDKKEYNYEKTKLLLQQKLNNVDPSKIVTPEGYVAVPALQALQYSMDSDELRNMYANLIAKAMNEDTKENVHPTFVEIIKQMSPVDAMVFENIYQMPVTPLINLKVAKEKRGYNNYVYNLSWIEQYSYEQVAVSINNLMRLGLIDIPYDKHYVEDNTYELVRNTSHYKEKKVLLEKKGRVEEEKNIIHVPELAKSFYEICVKE